MDKHIFLSLIRSSILSLSLLFQSDRERYEDRLQSLRRFHVIPNDGQASARFCRSQYLLVFHVYALCFPHREAIYMLMRAFLLGGNCFFLSGTFACHVAGILSGYKGAYLYITLSDTYLVCLLFQRIDAPTFSHAGFLFELLLSVQHDDFFVHKF